MIGSNYILWMIIGALAVTVLRKVWEEYTRPPSRFGGLEKPSYAQLERMYFSQGERLSEYLGQASHYESGLIFIRDLWENPTQDITGVKMNEEEWATQMSETIEGYAPRRENQGAN